MRIVKDFFWFWSLRTGSLATGWFSLLLSFAVFIIFTRLLAEMYSYHNSFNMFVFLRLIAAGGAAVGSFIAIFLIIGTVKRRKWFLLPWISYTLVGLPVLIPYVVLTLRYPTHPLLFVLVIVTLLLILMPLHFYFILVVISYFEEITMEDEGKMVRTNRRMENC